MFTLYSLSSQHVENEHFTAIPSFMKMDKNLNAKQTLLSFFPDLSSKTWCSIGRQGLKLGQPSQLKYCIKAVLNK